jgi:hypothetical protein
MPAPSASPLGTRRAACLSLPRVLSLIGGLGLVAAFFMPWFSAQSLLLSGQFLHQFLANPGDLRRFLPGSSGSPAEAEQLRALVDVFPASGVVATLATLVGGLTPWRWPANLILGLAGLIPLVGWAAGITRLPPGATAEVGLWLIATSSAAVLVGLILEVVVNPRSH